MKDQPKLQRELRVRRGVVAAYLHEISARHQHGERPQPAPSRVAVQPAR